MSNIITTCLELPTAGAWNRVYGGNARASLLEDAFSENRLNNGTIFAMYGPQQSGKTSVAFAIADHLNFNLVTPSKVKQAKDIQLIKQRSILLIDPVEAYNSDEINILLKDKPNNLSVILVGETKDVFDNLPINIHFKMKYPTSNGIFNYVHKMLENYKNHTLTKEDLQELSQAFTGLSFPQVNSIVVDAALTCLSEEKEINKEAFIHAIYTFKTIKNKYYKNQYE